MANTISEQPDMLGRGFSFPLRLKGGEVGMNQGEEQVRQSILLILGTGLNERAMRPEFGGDMEALVFEPMNAVTGVLLQHRVRAALARFEPRIDVVSVTTEAAPGQGALHVDITYRVRQTGTLGKLAYSFHHEGAR